MGARETARRRCVAGAAATLLTAGLLAGCAGDTSREPSDDAAPAPPSPSRSTEPPAPTPELDSIAVIGHSGATGFGTNPNDASLNVPANSWATGDNPAVNSIYQRLLVTHPALQGHNVNKAANGSQVYEHLDQAAAAMQENPVPDVVLLQTIDNDLRCDGTDRQNQRPFARDLTDVIRTVMEGSETVQLLIVSQWATVDEYTAAIDEFPNAVTLNAGTGPCATFDQQGRPDPAGRRSLQAIVDMYWRTVEHTCARFGRCFTDHGAMQEMRVATEDLTADYSHLSVAGHRKFAELAWLALPDAIRDRP